MVDELGRVGDREVRLEHAEMDRQQLQRVGAGVEDAAVVAVRLDRADPRPDPLGDDVAAGASTRTRAW